MYLYVLFLSISVDGWFPEIRQDEVSHHSTIPEKQDGCVVI